MAEGGQRCSLMTSVPMPSGVKISSSRVWDVDPAGKTDREIAYEGLETMETWMRELGLAMNITDCGARAELIEGMADACPINEGGYKVLTRADVVRVLTDSL